MSDSHIPTPPFSTLIIRIVQLVLAIIILGLAANTIDGCDGKYADRTLTVDLPPDLKKVCALTNDFDNLAPASFIIFCSVWTFIIVGYLIVTTLWFPAAYNIWAQLFFEITGCIFWLAGFAALAGKVRKATDIFNKTFSGSPYTVNDIGKWKTAAAASGLGAVMWILFIVTMVTFIMQLKRHLKDPANNKLGLSNAEKGNNNEMGVVIPQQPAPYVQQPTPAPGEYPQPVQSPVSYVQPTPPPQQWQQSPPPVQYQQ